MTQMRARLYLNMILAICLAPAALAELGFNRDVRPILSEKCFACHGLDAEHRKGELRLDLPEAAYGKGESGAIAIVPGDPDKSEAWHRINLEHGDDDVMPPAKLKKPMKPEERAIIKQWITEGAKFQKHWSFEPPVAKKLRFKQGKEIDHFIDEGLKAKKLKATKEAERSTLIRRVAFATTGLPPTAEELDMFLADKARGAYERMIDRYMAKPQYGEEMARHWLDIARYADTHGMHLDNERQMYAYRDWVVDSFNRNHPYDQFTIDQIAGDLIPDATNAQMVATGFNRCNITTGEGGSIAEEWIYRYAVERASTTAQTWLGLSAECAVCHDHKYDPISQKDFYSFYAFFHSNADPAMDGNKLLTPPFVKVAPADYDEKLADFNKRIAAIEAKMDTAAADVPYADPAEADPKPTVTESEAVWFEDDFPAGNRQGNGVFVTKPDPVFSGSRALKRVGPGLVQDFYDGGKTPLVVPKGATFFLYVYLDPANPPKEVMIQFHTSGWLHRAYWGENVIPWGKDGTGERFAAGKLPELGKWARLEVPAEKMNLKPGSKVTGFAFTIHDGTVYFDKMGIKSMVDPSKDPAQSFAAWRASMKGKKQMPGVPRNLQGWLRQGPEKPRKPEELAQLKRYYLRAVCTTTKQHFSDDLAALSKITGERDSYEKSFPSTFVFKDLAKPRQSFVMMRGQYTKPGEKVEPGTFAVLPPMKKAKPDARATRLDLAHWLVDRDNPLTARVTVNRFWQQLFGIGLVKTSHDLGTQGELPTHPELLDWLAVTFQDEAWDVKKLMRRIMLSEAFRRSSSAPAALWKTDPENRYLARGPRLRLDAEQLRDQALFTGGLLVMDMGGKGVNTYQPPNIWEPVGFRGSNTANYKRDNGAALYRRSIYTFLKRTAPAPFMSNFDAPNRESSCYRRDRSNTPLQALQLLNDVQFFEAARGLATRMMQVAKTPEERVTYAYRAVLSRSPSKDEVALILPLYNSQLKKYQMAADQAKATISFGESKAPQELDVAELAAWSVIASMVLNLDESIVRN
jgi:hypothetical protein